MKLALLLSVLVPTLWAAGSPALSLAQTFPTKPLRIAAAGSALAAPFFAHEYVLIEINPLFVIPDGAWFAGDVKTITIRRDRRSASVRETGFRADRRKKFTRGGQHGTRGRAGAWQPRRICGETSRAGTRRRPFWNALLEWNANKSASAAGIFRGPSTAHRVS